MYDPQTKKQHFFAGRCQGSIASREKGKAGFAYDRIFIPEGYEQTFAELGSEVKNKISHRAIALNKLKTYLKELAQLASIMLS